MTEHDNLQEKAADLPKQGTTVALALRRKLLEGAGYVVFTAVTASEALAFFKRYQVDLVHEHDETVNALFRAN
jgi:hypothetical protein